MQRPQPGPRSAKTPVTVRGRAARGFTLIELITTILIVAILTGLSVPLFTSFTRNQRLKTATSDLTYALVLARGEALKRNANVVVAPDANGWQFGWTVTTVQTVAGNPVTLTLLSHETPTYLNSSNAATSYLAITGPTSVTYNGSGRLTASVSSFQVASASSTAGVKTRCVTVTLSGLPASTVIDSGSCP